MSEQPKLWRDMTPEEKGALLLAHHEGKRIQIFSDNAGLWNDMGGIPSWGAMRAYRVKPEPMREIVTLHGRKYVTRVYPDGVWDFDRNDRQVDDTHRITFVVIDGKPDLDSIHMDELS